MARRELLVEGSNDLHVMKALLETHKVPEVFDVVKMEGVENLLHQLPTRLKQSDLERLAVVVDADEDLPSRWQQLKARLQNAGCVAIPEQLSGNGLKAQIPDGPRVGVWLMPNNVIPGMLENFLALLIPEEDDLLPRVDEFLAGIPVPQRRFPPPHWPKARMHTWLALQPEPGKPMGQAITARYLDAHSQAAASFLTWLHGVLVDDQ